MSVFFSFRRLNSFFRQEPYPQILLKKGKRLVCFFFLPKVKFFLKAGALSTNFAEEEKNLSVFFLPKVKFFLQAGALSMNLAKGDIKTCLSFFSPEASFFHLGGSPIHILQQIQDPSSRREPYPYTSTNSKPSSRREPYPYIHQFLKLSYN